MKVAGTYFADGEIVTMSFEPSIKEYGYAKVLLKNGKSYSVSCSVGQYNIALVDLEKAAKR